MGRMTKLAPARCRVTNWSAHNAALRRRGSLLVWVDREMAWHGSREGRPGRPAVFSDAAIQFCLSIKVLFKLPLRQSAGMVASLLRLAGLDWPVPDSSTLCRRQKTVTVQIPCRRADGPLNLLVDIEPVSATGSSEPARGHQVPRRRRVAGAQARVAAPPPVAQGSPGHGRDDLRHPRRRHPQPRR